MKKRRRLFTFLLTMLFAVSLGTLGLSVAANSALDSNDEEISYMRIKNHTGPSGVALGTTGAGYYEIDPTGKVTRTCINNIHKDFINNPDGMVVAAYDGNGAVRLSRDNNTQYGMSGRQLLYRTVAYRKHRF